MTVEAAGIIDPRAREFYVRALGMLDDTRVPYLVGGAYAFARYTGIERHTKDFDIFIRRSDFDRATEVLSRAGYKTELTFPHWIGKAWDGDDFIDLIFSAGNAVAEVDDLWFRYSVPETVLGIGVRLIPAEEMLWSKGLIMERERFDGADVAHVLHALGPKLDWRRLIRRYAAYWRVLYAHVILHGFIYPSDRSRIPKWVMEEFAKRLANELAQPDLKEKICYGTIVSRQQYLKDVTEWGYKDARLEPFGNMTAEGTRSGRKASRWTERNDMPSRETLRIAAVGDIHTRKNAQSPFQELFKDMTAKADVALLCGDLTDYGAVEEAEILAHEIRTALRIPALAVLGNHDYETGHQEEIIRIMCAAGVVMLDGDAHEINGVGFAGAKGFVGGFGRRQLGSWGEPGIKAIVHESLEEVLKLEAGLAKLRTPQKVAVLHYAPIPGTVEGEAPEVVPFLGSSRLEEPIERYRVTVAFHGHAHHGSPEGRTRGGVPVFNVAMPLLKRMFPDRPPYKLFEIPVGVESPVA